MVRVLSILLFVISTQVCADERYTMDCSALVSADAIDLCGRIERSKSLLEQVPVNFVYDKAKKSIIEREVVLAVCPKDESEAMIRLTTPLYPKAGIEITPVHDQPQRYRLQHVRGQYAHKLTFRVFELGSHGEREVPVCAAKHVFISPQFRGGNDPKQLERIRESKIYHPMTDLIYHEEFYVLGLEIKRKQMAEVFTAIAQKGVPSKAFPGELLAEHYQPEQLAKVFLIEQTDPFRRFGLLMFGKAQTPEPLLGKHVFAEMFVWGDEAFRDLCSHARACGRFQFTNNQSVAYDSNTKKRRVYPGTYASVVENCRDKAGKSFLEPGFWSAVKDHRNSAMAALCLLDMELAALPKEAREWYRREPEVGMVFPIIAYNTGGGWARRVFEKVIALEKAGYMLSLSNFEQLPANIFLGQKKGKPFFNQEPCYYAHKWLESWKYNNSGDPNHVPNCQ